MISFDVCCYTSHWNREIEAFCKAIAKSELEEQSVFVRIAVCDGIESFNSAKEFLSECKGAVQFDLLSVPADDTTAQAYQKLAQNARASFLVFCDARARLEPKTLYNLRGSIVTKGYTAMECRELPLESTRFYHPQTHEMEQIGGLCCCVERNLFYELGGFDEAMRMEDAWLDFSRRLRLQGALMHYVPKAVVSCACDTLNEPPIASRQDALNSLMSGYLLCLKYTPKKACKEWLWRCRQTAEDTNQTERLHTWEKQIRKRISHDRKFYRTIVRPSKLCREFSSTEAFQLIRTQTPQEGAFDEQHRLTVIVRTYRRPQVLRQALENLTMQTCMNFDVIVAEDGEEPMAQMVVQEFAARLSVRYLSAKAHVGRCEIGNLALKTVKTPYACFLDDDDYWYADYVETVSRYFAAYPACGMFCSCAVLAKVKLLTEDGSAYEVVSKENHAVRNLSRVDFCLENAVSIQAVVFRTELFSQYGGFDPALDAFEDWDLWLRYSMHTKICTIEKTLSLFKIPGEPDEAAARHNRMLPYRKIMLEKVAQQSENFTAQEVLTFLEKVRTVQTVDDTPSFHQSAEQIRQSAVWRAVMPVRRFWAAAAGLLSAAADGLMGASRWFGPMQPETQTREGYRAFVEETQWSPYFRLWAFLKKKKR